MKGRDDLHPDRRQRLPDMRGHLLHIMTPQQGREYTITLAEPEGPYIRIHKNQAGTNPSGDFGEWTRDAALHNPFPHFCKPEAD